MFIRKTKIEQLCRKSGKWAVTSFDKQDIYTVRKVSHSTVYPIMVLHHPKRTSTRFQAWLPVRFSLSNPPAGVFARLLLRSWDLFWSGWCINIGDSCEATACVTALIPNAALDADHFDMVCEEQTAEVAAFHQELRDKFHYTGQFDGSVVAGNAGRYVTGVPAVRPDGVPERYR